MALELRDRPLSRFAHHQTPAMMRRTSLLAFAGRTGASCLTLTALDDLPARTRREVSIPWSRFNWAEEHHRDADGSMDLAFSGLGGGVGERHREGERNTDRQIELVTSVAQG